MKFLLAVLMIFSLVETQAQTAFYGRTTGPLPYLEYGLGDDRLGGAKMTYLDTGVLVKVVDSVRSDYKLQLSAHHFAWMPKENLRFDLTHRVQPYYLSASWRVSGDEQYDYLSLSLPERLPYRSQQLLHPSRIAIDIYGLTSNTNWITQLKTVKEIKNVWYEQLEDDVFRVYVELEHDQHWGYALSYSGNNLRLKVKRPASRRLRGLRVAVDAGHGGSNTGASGLNTKVLEKDYTLLMAQALQKELRRKGAEVYMTRSHDTDLTMIDRTLMARAADPQVLISIHLNSSGNRAAKGTSTYYRYIGFRPLSQAVLDRMLQLKLNNFGNIGGFNFALSGPTEYPNCLVEVAFLSNADDEKLILDPRFHRQVARQVRKGVRDWLRQAR